MYNNVSEVEAIKVISMNIMGNDPAHGWPHVERVLALEDVIVRGEKLSVDRELLLVSTYLHDVGRFLQGEGHHAMKSAGFSRILLRSLGYDNEFTEKVVNAILAHSYSLGYRAETVEAMVLSDADKLDALGAIGIARVIHHGCKEGRGFEDDVKHISEKLLKLPDMMYFRTSKAIAEKRIKVIEYFISSFEEERKLFKFH